MNLTFETMIAARQMLRRRVMRDKDVEIFRHRYDRYCIYKKVQQRKERGWKLKAKPIIEDLGLSIRNSNPVFVSRITFLLEVA